MDVKQIYDFTNYAVEQATGQSALLKEDLSNVVEIGDAVMNANALDKYVDALVNHIGKMIFVTRVYNGVFAKLQMDSWEFGSVLEKVTAEMPQAEENESWELTDGVVYEENQFYKPIVSAKFYNKMTTFEIPLSNTQKQVVQSFSDFYGSGSQTASSGTRAVNLLYLYNQTITTPITASKALYDENFLKFASYTMSLYIDRLKSMSTLFNVGGKTRFTPKNDLHFVVLSNFAKASDMYLQSDTFHKELVALPQYESVPYFQGTGTSYDFADTSKIYVKTASGNDITINGVVGVMFDRDACAVNNFNRRTTSKWNAKAEFTNYWNKCDARYFNDLNENCVVFFIA